MNLTLYKMYRDTPTFTGSNLSNKSSIDFITLDHRFVNESGEVKPISLGDPTLSTHAATKNYVDTNFSLKSASYTKTEVDNAVNLKRNIADSYTKTEVDNAVNLKRNIADSYTKTEVDNAVNLKRNTADSYTKTEIDKLISENTVEVLGTLTSNTSNNQFILTASENSNTAFLSADGNINTGWSPNVGTTTNMWIQIECLNMGRNFNRAIFNGVDGISIQGGWRVEASNSLTDSWTVLASPGTPLGTNDWQINNLTTNYYNFYRVFFPSGGTAVTPISIRRIRFFETVNTLDNVRYPVNLNSATPRDFVEKSISLSSTISYTVGYIPTMSVVSQNGFEVTASSNFVGFDAFRAVDGSTTTEWATNNQNANYWLKIKCPRQILIYKMTASGRNSSERPLNWRLEGSNDNSTWTVLIADHTNDIVFAGISENVTTTVKYQYFRLFVSTSVSGSANPGLSSFQIFRKESLFDALPERFDRAIMASSTSNGLMASSDKIILDNLSNKCKIGYIPSLVSTTGGGFIITGSSNYDSTSYAVFRPFDNQDSTDWATSNESANYWVKIQCPEAVKVWRILVRGRVNGECPNTWRFEGSNDNSTWTALIASSTNPLTSLKIIEISNTSTAYLYFRFFATNSTSGSSNPGLSVLQLFILNF